MNSVYDFRVQNINGQPLSLGTYKGKVLLLVNVASKCGLTPQYEGLEELYENFQSRGFEVLGFPANEFAGQEPGSNQEIQQFCSMKFGIKFPMFAKIAVKGPEQHPLYRHLTTQFPMTTKNPGSVFEQKLAEYGEHKTQPNEVLWNFEKFLIGRDGQIIGRFAPDMVPNDPILLQAIETALT